MVEHKRNQHMGLEKQQHTVLKEIHKIMIRDGEVDSLSF